VNRERESSLILEEERGFYLYLDPCVLPLRRGGKAVKEGEEDSVCSEGGGGGKGGRPLSSKPALLEGGERRVCFLSGQEESRRRHVLAPVVADREGGGRKGGEAPATNKKKKRKVRAYMPSPLQDREKKEPSRGDILLEKKKTNRARIFSARPEKKGRRSRSYSREGRDHALSMSISSPTRKGGEKKVKHFLFTGEEGGGKRGHSMCFSMASR